MVSFNVKTGTEPRMAPQPRESVKWFKMLYILSSSFMLYLLQIQHSLAHSKTTNPMLWRMPEEGCLHTSKAKSCSEVTAWWQEIMMCRTETWAPVELSYWLTNPWSTGLYLESYSRMPSNGPSITSLCIYKWQFRSFNNTIQLIRYSLSLTEEAVLETKGYCRIKD